VGAVTRDNRTAIAGKVGATAAMIPVAITLPEGSTPREVHFRVFATSLSGPIITIGVLNGLVANAAYVAEERSPRGKNRARRISRRAAEPHLFRSRIAGRVDPLDGVRAGGTFQKLFDNDLAATQIKQVTISLAIERSTWRRASTERGRSFRTARRRAADGSRAAQAISRRLRSREIRVKIPESTPAGPLTIVAGDARSIDARDRVAPGLIRADDVASLVAQFNQRRSEDALYVRVSRPGAGAIVKGTALPALPPTRSP